MKGMVKELFKVYKGLDFLEHLRDYVCFQTNECSFKIFWQL